MRDCSEHSVIIIMVLSPGGSVVTVEDGCATKLLVAVGVDDGTITIVGNQHILTFPYFSNSHHQLYLQVQANLQKGRDQTPKHFYQMDY